MRKLNLFMCAAALLMCWSAASLADEGGGYVEGTTQVGAHYSDDQDNPGRVGEYTDLEDVKDLAADMYLELFGGTHNTLFDMSAYYMSNHTKGFDFDLHTKSYLSAEFGYDSFMHNLDHDNLENMQAREGVPDGSGGYNPGGKQIYHTDNDPLGRYYLEYQKFHGDVKMDLPFLEGGQVTFGYTDQRKTGYEQQMTIDHCAFCHVESDAKRVDQQTRTWTAAAKATMGQVSLNYDFVKTDFTDHTTAPTHLWKNANHPVNGGMADEFSSRLIFEDVMLPYGRGVDNDKYSHNAGVKVNLSDGSVIKGSYTHTRRNAYWTGIQSKFNAGAFGYAKKINQDVRLTAKFVAYETKVDDYFVDLPNFRAADATYGNLDFDWTRISAANRRVYQGDVNVGWKVGKGRRLKLGWRHQIIDRDAMAQNQTTYLFDGVNNGNAGATPVESTPYANETTVNRLKARYDARMGTKGNYNVTYTFTNVDKPFMNPTAMCEESLVGTNSAHTGGAAAGRIYYFQRQRYGNGTSSPNQAHQLAVRGSYQLSPRTSFNAFLNYATEKNDDLNSYEFDRDMISPGVNLWTAPDDRLLFTLGWTYQKVESNANLCPPFFDG